MLDNCAFKKKISSNLKLCSKKVKDDITWACFDVMLLKENSSCFVWTLFFFRLCAFTASMWTLGVLFLSLLRTWTVMWMFLLQVPVYYMNTSVWFGVFLFGLRGKRLVFFYTFHIVSKSQEKTKTNNELILPTSITCNSYISFLSHRALVQKLWKKTHQWPTPLKWDNYLEFLTQSHMRRPAAGTKYV